MSCYHPLLGIPEYRSEEGNWVFVPRGKYDPELAFTWQWTSKENKKGDRPLPIKVPCGKCVGCRLDYSRTWADRMMLELDHSKKAIFLTLTYNNDHVPFTEDESTGEFGVLSLDKRDVQLFFKRLRKRYSDKEIRFYLAGEYGTHTQRPHYHAIVFGLGVDDFPKKKPVKKNELGQMVYTCQELQDTWSILQYVKVPKVGKKGQILKSYDKISYYEPIGFISFSDVSWKTCAYVARYVMKKVNGNFNYLQDEFGAVPEFSLMSRKPGIGGYYFFDHPDMYDWSKLYPKGCPDGVNIPYYHIKKLKLTDKELFDKIKAERSEFAKDGVLKKLINTDLSYLEQLEVEENQKLAKLKALKRL